MIDAPSSTWFTASPHWHGWIVLYFILGALAGGCYFLAAMIDMVGRPADRRLARLGYFIVLPLMGVIGIVLIVDLARPDRFWHLLLANHTLRPMFKPWVPMSTGSWAVPLLGLFSLLSFVAAFAEQRERTGRFGRLARRLRPPGALGWAVVVPGALLALHVTGYTGVMLSVLNRPVWSDSPLFGLLFIVSAVTMAAALLVLGARALDWHSPGVTSLRRICVWLLVLQLPVLAALFVTLGPAARGWLNVWGLVLALGVLVGILVPLAALLGRAAPRTRTLPLAAALVLAGGFAVRAAVVLVPEVNAP